MRTLRSSAVIIALLLVVSGCNEGDFEGFDGSIFPEEDGGAHAHHDAGATDEDDAGEGPGDSGVSDAGPSTPPPTIDEVSLGLATAACQALTACRGPELLNDFLKGQDCITNRAH